MQAKDSNNRSIILDCIRSTAVIMVVFFHVATRIDYTNLGWLGKFFFQYGAYGVDVFFPLSGYLITRTLLRSQYQYAIRNFFLRRFFRIVPLYFAAVTVYVAALILFSKDTSALSNIWVTYSFLTGWFVFFWGKEHIPYLITWSLSVEEFSYIVLGICAYLFRNKFLFVLISLIVVPTFLRFYFHSESMSNIHFFPLTRIDSIAWGGLVAYFIFHNIRGFLILLMLCVTCFVILTFGGLYYKTFFHTLLPLVPGLFIYVYEVFFKHIRFNFLRSYASIGFYSYFIYLFHLFVIDGILIFQSKLGYGELSFVTMCIASLAITYVAARISFKLYEEPAMRYGRTLERQVPPLKSNVTVP